MLSRGAGSREGWRATRGIAVKAFGHRAGVSAPRIHAAARRAPALGRRLAATFDAGFLAPFASGFLARVRTARARATGGVCDAARASHALSELKRVHGRDGTRVACVAMPRPVHHASQTATRRRSRVFRVSPVQAREKKHRRRDGTPGRDAGFVSPDAAPARSPEPIPRHPPLAYIRLDADDPFDSIPCDTLQVEEPPLAPSTRCPSRAPSAR